MADFYRFKKFDEVTICRHAVSTKNVTEPYAFSVALHTGENIENIVANRKKILSMLGWDESIYFVLADQTHSDHIVIIDKEETKGWVCLDDAVANCDALITNKRDVVLAILTADCVPVLLLDINKGVVAAVHAGWRGSKKQIVANTVAKMVDVFDCKAENIIAGIAPSIGRCCYEVGEEVVENFKDIPNAYDCVGTKFMLDLPFINKIQLINAGLQESNIEMSNICTSCEAERFFSYRKEQGCSGRFISMIGLI